MPWPDKYQTDKSAKAPPLNTAGREMPPIHPQSLGHAMSEVVGNWAVERKHLVSRFKQNLNDLAEIPSSKVEQLRHELTLHWHAMSEVEKVAVLDLVGQTGGAAAPAPRIESWLTQTLIVTPPEQRE